jgi:hypothetical protein
VASKKKIPSYHWDSIIRGIGRIEAARAAAVAATLASAPAAESRK